MMKMYKWTWSVLLGLLVFCVLQVPTAAAPAESVTIIVKTSPESEFFSCLLIQDKGRLAQQILKSDSRPAAVTPQLTRATITIGSRSFVFDSYNRLYELAGNSELILSSTVEQALEQYISQLERVHFGQPDPWQQVKKHFRRMSYATVTDLETGMSFSVQRRAGSRHADVQPLTLRDTKTMKQIYQGKWSWRRRAVLVTIDGKQYAASMNGMPHGAGAIRGNGFPGHFCIHFTDSTTHGQRKVDPGHALMVEKASGKFRDRIMHATPSELTDFLLIALREQDRGIIQMIVRNMETLPFKTEEIQGIRRSQKQAEIRFPDELTVVIPVQMSYSRSGKIKKEETWNVVISRASWFDRWTVSAVMIDLPGKKPRPKADIPPSDRIGK